MISNTRILIFKSIILFILCLFCGIGQSSRMPDDNSLPITCIQPIKSNPYRREAILENDTLVYFRKQVIRERKLFDEKGPERPEFSWPIYENDPEASQLFLEQYLQPLKDAEAFKEAAQSFDGKRLGRRRVKETIKKMKEDCFFHYSNQKFKEAAYIWHEILKSPHYHLSNYGLEETSLNDQEEALFYFSLSGMNLSALDLGKKLIKQKQHNWCDLKNILNAYNNFSSAQLQQKSHLDFILDICAQFHYERRDDFNDISYYVVTTLTKIRAIHPQYWQDKIISHPYWHDVLIFLNLNSS